MSFSVETLETNVKKVFSGKKKWFIIGGIALLLLIFMFTRKKSSSYGVAIDEYPTLNTESGSISGSGSGSGVSSGDLSLIRDNFTQQVSDLAQATKDSIEKQNAIIAQNNESTKGMFDGITDAFGKQQSSFQDALNSINADFSKLQTDYNSNLANIQAQANKVVNSGSTSSSSSSSSSSNVYNGYTGSGAGSTQSAQQGQTSADRIDQAQGTTQAKEQAKVDAAYNDNRLQEIRNQLSNKKWNTPII